MTRDKRAPWRSTVACRSFKHTDNYICTSWKLIHIYSYVPRMPSVSLNRMYQACQMTVDQFIIWAHYPQSYSQNITLLFQASLAEKNTILLFAQSIFRNGDITVEYGSIDMTYQLHIWDIWFVHYVIYVMAMNNYFMGTNHLIIS